MPKTIQILQNGSEKNLSKVAKIRTMLATGENCDWIPEADVPLGILSVTQDGVYDPSQDPNGPFYGYSMVNVEGVGNTEMGQLAEITITKNGTYDVTKDKDGSFYGYSKVIVNVKKKSDDVDGGSSKPVTGKDGDGDDAIAGVDEDGNIYTQKLPTRISISVYPNNLVYEDGQSIDFTGLRVKAFLPDGTEWGVVPDNEILTPVTVAEGNGSGESSTEYATLHGLTINIGTSTYEVNNSGISYTNSFTGGRGVLTHALRDDGYALGVYAASDSGVSMVWTRNDGFVMGTYPLNQIYTVGTNTVYYTSTSGPGWSEISPTSNIELFNYSVAEIAYAMVYDSYSVLNFQQTIPLQWWRPGDHKVLETSFSIAVHSS